MEHPLLLLIGMVATLALIFAVTRRICRDPDLLQAEGYMERQQALAEAVVRQMDTHELVAIASGWRGAGGGLLLRGRGRLPHRFEAERTGGVSQETRSSFVKLRAGGIGHAPSHEDTAPPVATRIASSSSSSNPDEERKCPRGTDCFGGSSSSSGRNKSDVTPCSTADASPSASSRPRSSKRLLIAGEAAMLAGDGAAADGAGGMYSDNSCSVCLDEYEEGDQLLQLTCGHVFHRACIDLWLKGHCVCPCCRTDLDKLAQVVQLFPQINKRALQGALMRAEGNIVIAVELLLAQTTSCIAGSPDSAALSGASAVPVREAQVAAASEAAADYDACERRRGRRWEARAWDGSTSRSSAQRGSPMWARDAFGGGRIGGRFSSQDTTPRASIDPSLPEEGENDTETMDTSFHGAAAQVADAEEMEVAAAVCSATDGDVERSGGGIRAGEVVPAAGAAVAAVAGAVGAAGTSISPRGCLHNGSCSSATPSREMASARVWGRRSASWTADDAHRARRLRADATQMAHFRSVTWADSLRPSGPRGESSAAGARSSLGQDAMLGSPPMEVRAALAPAEPVIAVSASLRPSSFFARVTSPFQGSRTHRTHQTSASSLLHSEGSYLSSSEDARFLGGSPAVADADLNGGGVGLGFAGNVSSVGSIAQPPTSARSARERPVASSMVTVADSHQEDTAVWLNRDSAV